MIPGGLLLATAGLIFAFHLDWQNFWVRIAIAVGLTVAYSLIWKRFTLRFRISSILWGVFTAALLYGIFWIGNLLVAAMIPEARNLVEGVYDMGTARPVLPLFYLLLFLTGPGEEIFWRGFIQDTLMKRWGGGPGFFAATLAYALVHLVSGNIMIVLSALTLGLYWGALYLWKRDMLMLIVSHGLWSGVVFGFFPIR